jgi:hypothetical protein
MAADRGEYRQAAELTSQGLVGRSPMTDFDEPKDPSWLLAFDWVELNKLQRAYKDGGDDALEGACRELMNKDMPQFARIACAYMPDQMPQRIKEALEDDGYSFEELIELAKKRH